MIQHAFQQQLLDDPLKTTVDYYAQHLNQNAHTFLTRMRLSADQTLRVGFSDRTLGLQIPNTQRKLGREIRKRLGKLGILKSNGHEAFRGFVTAPLNDVARRRL
jgi:DNA primase